MISRFPTLFLVQLVAKQGWSCHIKHLMTSKKSTLFNPYISVSIPMYELAIDILEPLYNNLFSYPRHDIVICFFFCCKIIFVCKTLILA